MHAITFVAKMRSLCPFGHFEKSSCYTDLHQGSELGVGAALDVTVASDRAPTPERGLCSRPHRVVV